MAVPQGEHRTEYLLKCCHSTGKASTWSTCLTDWKQSCAGYELVDPDSVDRFGTTLNSEIADERTGLLDAEVFRDSDSRIGGRGRRWDRLHCSQFDVAGMMAEGLRHFVAGIEAGVGTGTGLAAGTTSEVGCTEPGIRHWGSSCHLVRRKGFGPGHQCSRWRLGRRGKLSEGS